MNPRDPTNVETEALSVEPQAPDALESGGSLAELASTFVGRRRGPEDDETRELPPGAERYIDQGRLGRGGMGEVRQVMDTVLDRTLAMKVLRAERFSEGHVRRQFLEEARVTAGLEHPGIVPVHDLGTLPDGRPYFTMKQVEGRVLGEAIRELHGRGEDEPGLRALLEVFQRACEAVAFAHARGIVHRDLKPSNIMIGPYGDVLVLDWGLAARVGTQVAQGQLAGTPEYMAPEAFLRLPLDERVDVWSLGVVLCEILCGARPFRGADVNALLAAMLRGPPPKVNPPAWVPEELRQLCLRMLRRRPEARPANAGEVVSEIAAFLHGSRQRALAEQLLAQAEARGEQAELGRARARELKDEAARKAAEMVPTAPEAVKRPLWDLEDQSRVLEQSAEIAEIERLALLRQALTHAPNLTAAHAGLVALYVRQVEQAERRRDAAAATQAEILLRDHLPHLGEQERDRVGAWLRGDGAVTLLTDAPAEVLAFRCELQGRRLRPRFVKRLGWTPLVEVPLGRGSWVLLLRAPGRPPVRYPVHLGRGELWSGLAPGETEPAIINLPRQLRPGERYVPAGWFLSGGAPTASGPSPLVPLWCPGFVIGRDPVTNAEYLAYLQDLDARGRPSAPHAPRYPASGDVEPPIRGEPGAWEVVGHPQAPVTFVSWWDGVAFAAWKAEREGLPWRLPAELEWEKAARGVDGRTRPWGEHADPAFALTREHNPNGGSPAPVWRFAADRSPYGVRGMGGNTRDWCLDPYRVEGPETSGQRVHIPLGASSPNGAREARGAHLADLAEASRVTLRGGGVAEVRRVYLGFRVARSLVERESEQSFTQERVDAVAS